MKSETKTRRQIILTLEEEEGALLARLADGIQTGDFRDAAQRVGKLSTDEGDRMAEEANSLFCAIREAYKS